MATVYNSQLDAFTLHHQIREDNSSTSFFSPDGSALPALGHSVSGSTGAAISNLVTYPLDLIITRLQIQRNLRKDQSTPSEDEYKSFQDAARKIYENEGGIAGFYTGVLQDTGKTIVDSFCFFLLYNWLRSRRTAARGPEAKHLPAIDELGVGFVAGSVTKLLTTPIANIVTRKQAAALTESKASVDGESTKRVLHTGSATTAGIARDIMAQKGVLGFWSGYSASLILTLNPSLTFFLFETFKRLLLPRAKRENPPAAATFLMAAVSKACASSVTYPFSLAKARVQAGTKGSESDGKNAIQSTIFGTLLSIARREGISGMYEGLDLEIVKGFFSHGITMIVKQAVHKFLIQAYYILSIIFSKYSSGTRANPAKLMERAKQQSFEYYDLAIARASEKVTEAQNALKANANETAEFVAEYVEEDLGVGEWRDLYGTGLARWLDEKGRD